MSFNRALSSFKFCRFRSSLSRVVSYPREWCDDKCPTKLITDDVEDVKNKWSRVRVSPSDYSHKITIVGAGAVGVSCCNTILFQKLSKHIVLIDKDSKKLKGEAIEYFHSSMFLDGCRVEPSCDLSAAKKSKIIIICAGERQEKDETRLDLAQRNVDIFKEIIPKLAENNKDAVFIIVTNPVDVLSWVTWKISGLPTWQVIGTGTLIDTARLAYALSNELNCDVDDIHAYILGEHGDSQVPIWSQVFYEKTKLLRSTYPNCGLCPGDIFNNIAEGVRTAGNKIRCSKGYTNTTVSLAVADIVKSILYGKFKIRPLSILAQGRYGIDKEVFISLPCEIDGMGLHRIYHLPLDCQEEKLMQASANIIYEVQNRLQI